MSRNRTRVETSTVAGIVCVAMLGGAAALDSAQPQVTPPQPTVVGIVLEKNLASCMKLAFEGDLLWTVGADTPGSMVLGELTYYLTDDLALRAMGFFLDSHDDESSNSHYRQGNFTPGLNYRF